MKFMFAALLPLVALSVGTLSAAAMFPQCPADGANTGCQFLITVNADNSVTLAADPNAPNNGPYDGSDDTLVGILNNSATKLTSLPLSSSLDIFNFEADGPCSVTPHPAACPSTAGFPGDPTGYGGPGVTYSGISADFKSGLVNLSGGLATGQSAWFGLEDALSASQIVAGAPGASPGGGGGTVPEPASVLTLASGLGILALIRRARRS